jgi:hypothetical protein
MKKTLIILTLFALLCCVPLMANAKPLTTSLGADIALPFSKDLMVLPCIPEIKMLPKPGIKTFKPDKFQAAQCQAAQGFWLQPGVGSERGPAIVEYLKNSPELVDSIKLRLVSRAIKAGYLKTVKKDGTLEVTEKYREWYTKNANVPIPLLIDVGFGSGPAMGPIPCALKLEDKKGWLDNLNPFSSKDKIIFFNSIMLIEDIKDAFDVTDAMKNDTLDLVFCHENAHAIMFDMYGNQMDRVQKLSNIGHDSHLISDRGLAYIEGWAEAFEALYGPTNPLLKLKAEERKKYRISEFLFGRQDPIRRQRYIWVTTKQKTGLLKTGQQIVSTEGVVAGIYHSILTSRVIKQPFQKCVSVMYFNKPTDIIQFLLSWVKMYPKDQRVLYRIFLENTNYATASNDARKLYHEYYQGKLLYVKKKMAKDKFYALKKAWTDHKEEIFKQCIANPTKIAANIGSDLWFELGPNHKYKGLRVNLNNATIGFLTGLLGLTEDQAVKLVQTRSAQGFLKGKDPVKALTAVLGADAANKIISTNELTVVKVNPVKDFSQGWLAVMKRIPQKAFDRMAQMKPDLDPVTK